MEEEVEDVEEKRRRRNKGKEEAGVWPSFLVVVV